MGVCVCSCEVVQEGKQLSGALWQVLMVPLAQVWKAPSSVPQLALMHA